MAIKTLKDLFNYVWDTRPHISEISKQPLLPKGSSQWHWQFLHILPHGSYPSYKFNPENIMLATVKEHEHQESIPEFKERYEQLKQQYYKEVYNKQF